MGCVDYCKHWSCQDEQRNTPKVVQIPFTCETKSRVHVIPKYCQCSPINPKSSSCCVWCPLLHWNVSFISFFFFFKVSHLKRQKTMSVDGFSNSKLKLLHLKKKIRTEFECTFIHISQPRVVGTAHQTPWKVMPRGRSAALCRRPVCILLMSPHSWWKAKANSKIRVFVLF